MGAASEGARFMRKSIALSDQITIELRVVKKGKAVKKVSVQPASVTVAPGEITALTATAKPKSAKYKTIYWHSDDPSIATVDERGAVTGVSAGETRIIAMSTSGVYATVSVTVAK